MGLLFTGTFRRLEADLVARVREVREGRLLEPLTLIAGSYALAGHVRRLLAAGLGAYAGIEVVTLDALARQMAGLRAAHDGGSQASLRPLSWLARERLVRRLLDERRAGPGLSYFEPVAETPGLAAAFVHSTDDLRQGCVGPGADLRHAVVRQDKGADIAAVYRDYCATLAARSLADAASLYERATGLSGGQGTFLLYGFADLNGVQMRLVESLARSGRLDAFVPVPSSGAGWSTALAVRLDHAGLTPAGSSQAGSTTAAPDVGSLRAVDVLEERVFADDPPATPVALDGSVGIVSAVNERAEVREAARECLEAAAQVRFHEMAVVAPSGEVADRVGEAFVRSGIPVARSLPDGSRHVRGLAHLLDAVAPVRGERFERHAVVDFLLTSELRGESPDTAGGALWADEARRAGIVAGEQQWRDRLRRHEGSLEGRLRAVLADGDGEEEDLDGDEPSPAAVRRALLERRIAATRTLRLAAGRLFKAASLLPADASWPDLSQALARLVRDLVVLPEDVDISGELGQLESLGAVERGASLAEAVATLREALAGRRVRHGSLGRRGVAVLTPLQCRGLSFRLVVVVGMSEAGFPPRPRQDPILLDVDRTRIAAGGEGTLQLASERQAESRFLLTMLCEAARERLVFVYPRLDAATGRPLLPSRYLLRVVRALTGRDLPPEDFAREISPGLFRHAGSRGASGDGSVGHDQRPEWMHSVDERELDIALLMAAAGDGRHARREAVAREYLDVLLGRDDAGRRREKWRALRSPEVGPWDAVFADPGALRWLHEHDPLRDEVSPTALEAYIRCPFVFLATQILGLSVPEEPVAEAEMENREFGKLAHAILQGVYGRVLEDGLDRAGALSVLPEVAAAACRAKEDEGVTGAPVVWHARRDLLLEDLAHVVRTDPLFDRGAGPAAGRPLALEWSFGVAHDLPVSLTTPRAQLHFRGRVDRVDLAADGSLHVIDYKTGSGSTEHDRVRARRSVQLPVYLLAARQCLADQGQAIGCSYALVTRKGSFASIDLPDDEATTLAGLAELCDAVAGAAAMGLYPRSPADTWGCKYCDLKYVCDVDAWSHRRKRRRDGALAPVIAVQTSESNKAAADGD